MDVVTLTFPGHFFQTALSIQSVHRFYNPDKHYIILDDLEQGVWGSYAKDAQEFYGPGYVYLLTSDIPKMSQTLSGWWRQQLIKLTIDQLIDGNEWLLVDGDVVFDSFCEYKNIIPIDTTPLDDSNIVEPLTVNYVKKLLGCDKGHLYYDGRPCLSSPIPYRYLTEELLVGLRQHVEQRFKKDFVDLHIGWFHDQTIVGAHDDLSKLSMSEWELIEIFKKEILNDQSHFLPIGPGYSLLMQTSDLDISHGVYRHGYIRDAQIDKSWFASQGLSLTDTLWKNSQKWIVDREPWRS